MQIVNVPWGQWYEQASRELSFPDDWDVRVCRMKHCDAMTPNEIERKIDSPIGCSTLSDLAKGKKSACIIIDDITRPTDGALLLPFVIERFRDAGIDYENIKVLLALGAHRPMTKKEMELKVGKWVLSHVQVLNHSPFADDLVTVHNQDSIIRINKVFMDAELRVAVGCIVPHTLAGFSGGAKAVIPGIGGIETLHANHTLAFSDTSHDMSFMNSTCDPDNAMRKNMESIVGKVGLDFVVNVVLNDEMRVADVFSGDFIRAHRMACESAVKRYETQLVEDADVIVLGSFPKDTEYSQLGTCFSVMGQYKAACVKPGGTIVCMTAASEGPGFHSLFGPGMGLFAPHDDNIPPEELRGRDTFIFSDGVTRVDIRQFYRDEPREVFAMWPLLLERLMKKYQGKRPKVAVYPMGTVQIGQLHGGY